MKAQGPGPGPRAAPCALDKSSGPPTDKSSGPVDKSSGPIDKSSGPSDKGSEPIEGVFQERSMAKPNQPKWFEHLKRGL